MKLNTTILLFDRQLTVDGRPDYTHELIWE